MSVSILIVDDSSMMRKIVRKHLEEGGYQVAGEASNGEEAIESYKQIKPDLVTMDITMRGMDGVTAAKEIFVFDPDAKIIFLSNLDDEKYREEIQRIGALGMVQKHDADDTLNMLKSLGF